MIAVTIWNFSNVAIAKDPALANMPLATTSVNTCYSNFILVFESEILKGLDVAETIDWTSSISLAETSENEEIPSLGKSKRVANWSSSTNYI